jgi:hypothetical protein
MSASAPIARTSAALALLALLAACAGDGADRYAAPAGSAQRDRERDYAACRDQGGMIRDEAERAIMIDNCMGDLGYRLNVK